MSQSESTDLVPGDCADDEGVEGALALYQVVVVTLQQQRGPVPPATNHRVFRVLSEDNKS